MCPELNYTIYLNNNNNKLPQGLVERDYDSGLV